MDSPSSAKKIKAQPADQNLARWKTALVLGLALVSLDAYIRWVSQYPILQPTTHFWTLDSGISLLRTWIACLIETLAFDGGVIMACLVVKWALAQTKTYSHSPTRDQLRASHVPLSVFYSSFTKLFLLLLLSIWNSSTSELASTTGSHQSVYLPELLVNHQWVRIGLEAFDENKLDREWVVRNLIGGMAAGFGLRVVLDCPPVITTLVVIFGWAIKTSMAWSISGWASHDPSKHWIAYSIP